MSDILDYLNEPVFVTFCVPKIVLDDPVHCYLSARTTKACWRVGVRTIRELTRIRPGRLLGPKGNGPMAIREVREFLAGMGLSLLDDPLKSG